MHLFRVAHRWSKRTSTHPKHQLSHRKTSSAKGSTNRTNQPSKGNLTHHPGRSQVPGPSHPLTPPCACSPTTPPQPATTCMHIYTRTPLPIHILSSMALTGLVASTAGAWAVSLKCLDCCWHKFGVGWRVATCWRQQRRVHGKKVAGKCNAVEQHEPDSAAHLQPRWWG